MGKTAEEIGLIVGGIALAATGIGLGVDFLISTQVMMGMVGIGVSATLSGVGLALRPTPQPVSTNGLLSFNNGTAFRRVIYGQPAPAAGVLTFADFPPGNNTSVNTQELELIYTLSSHEITSFDAVIIDGTPLNFGTDLVFQFDGTHYAWFCVVPHDLYYEHLLFEFDFGRNNVTPPFPVLNLTDPMWNTACLQKGCAKVHVQLRADASYPTAFPGALFQSGRIPNIQFVVTGKKLIDPRVITAWAASTSYAKYSYIVDNFGVVWVQMNSAAASGSTRPAFETNDTPGTTLSDGSLSWRSSGLNMTTISAGTDGSPQGHLVNGRLMNDAWSPGAGYVTNGIIEAPLGYLQMATNSGTTGTSFPSFSTTRGGTTTDNTQDFVCLGRSWHAINPSNPALIVNDYVQDSDAGLDAAASTIDTSSVIAAANVCEEQALIIVNSDSTSVYENLYACDGVFDHSSVRGNVLSALCGSMAGWVIPPGDMWHIFAGAYVTPTISLGDKDLRGGIKGDFRLSKREVANSIQGTYNPGFLPINGAIGVSSVPPVGQETSFPAYQANGLVTGKPNYLNVEDGGQVIWQQVTLDFTKSLWGAQRLAKITLMRLRFQQTMTLPFKLSVLAVAAGDTFYFTHSRWGFASGVFQAENSNLVFDASGGGKVPAIGVDLIGRQVDPSIYTFIPPSSATNYGEYSPYGITGVMTGVE